MRSGNKADFLPKSVRCRRGSSESHGGMWQVAQHLRTVARTTDTVRAADADVRRTGASSCMERSRLQRGHDAMRAMPGSCRCPCLARVGVGSAMAATVFSRRQRRYRARRDARIHSKCSRGRPAVRRAPRQARLRGAGTRLQGRSPLILRSAAGAAFVARGHRCASARITRCARNAASTVLDPTIAARVAQRRGATRRLSGAPAASSRYPISRFPGSRSTAARALRRS